MRTKRGIFKHHKADVWKTLAAEMHGEYLEKEAWHRDLIRAQEDGWTVTMDFHSEAGYRSAEVYTRFRAVHPNMDRFRFAIYHHKVFDSIASLLGQHQFKTGEDHFDRMFTVKTSDEDKVRRILAHRRLRDLLETEPEINVQLRDSGDWFAEEHPEGVDELILEVEGEVKSLPRMERLYELFAEFLHAIDEVEGFADGTPA